MSVTTSCSPAAEKKISGFSKKKNAGGSMKRNAMISENGKAGTTTFFLPNFSRKLPSGGRSGCLDVSTWENVVGLFLRTELMNQIMNNGRTTS